MKRIYCLLALTVLAGCDSKPTPEQVKAKAHLEDVTAAYEVIYQPLIDELMECNKVNDAKSCADKFYDKQRKIPTKIYDRALAECQATGLTYKQCTGFEPSESKKAGLFEPKRSQ